jgi:hypothetical protein
VWVFCGLGKGGGFLRLSGKGGSIREFLNGFVNILFLDRVVIGLQGRGDVGVGAIGLRMTGADIGMVEDGREGVSDGLASPGEG